MRKIITTTFVTLDGVMQAPGGPEEDTSGGFKYGGWMFRYGDEMTDEVMNKFMSLAFELLLGKKTYDIFAAYWPHAETDLTVAKPFNSTRKYVVSHEPAELTWHNSTLMGYTAAPDTIDTLYREYSRRCTLSIKAGSKSGYVEPSDYVIKEQRYPHAFPPDYTLLYLDKQPLTEKKDSNQPESHGVAISKKRCRIVYWVGNG